VPIRDAQGSVVKWYGTHTDVDDLKHAVVDQRQRAERLTAVLDWISKPSLVLDDRLRINWVNSAAVAALGQRLGDIGNRPFFDVFPEAVGRPLKRSCSRRAGRADTSRPSFASSACCAKGLSKRSCRRVRMDGCYCSDRLARTQGATGADGTGYSTERGKR
jgi:PAS domain-containing protein